MWKYGISEVAAHPLSGGDTRCDGGVGYRRKITRSCFAFSGLGVKMVGEVKD
jgi:hypothetical protein